MRKLFLVVLGVMFVASAAFATYYTDKTIYDIQYVADPATDDASALVGDTVTIEAYVTFEPKSWSSTKFFVADDAGAWNGIYVYDADYRALDLGFGWKVSFTAEVMEYYNITELALVDTSEVRVISTTVDWRNPPAALTYNVVSAEDLAGGAATAEQYEGCLVMVEDVTCSGTASYGEWYVQDTATSTYTVKIDDSGKGYYHNVATGQPYDYIRGILYYDYSEYKIAPEISHDLKVAEDTENGWYTQFSYFQQVRPSDMVIRYDEFDNSYMTDASYESADYWEIFDEDTTFIEDTLTVKGVISMAPYVSYAGGGVKFNMSDYTYAGEADATEMPWSSVLSYDPDSTAFPAMLEGFIVQVTGYISEYVMDEGYMTEMFITEEVQVLGSGTKPAPVQVDVQDMRTPEDIEPYETGFAYILGSVVIDNNPTGWSSVKFAIDDDTEDEYGEIGVDGDTDWFVSASYNSPYWEDWDTFGDPPVGANVDSVVGWLYPHYGSYDSDDADDWVWKLVPLNPMADIEIGDGPPVIVNVARDLVTPTPAEEVVITADITDDVAVDSAKVFYKVEIDGAWNSIAMTADGDTYSASIPAGSDGDNIWFFVQAFDYWDSESAVHSSFVPSDTSRGLYGYVVKSAGLELADIQYTPYDDGLSRFAGYEVTVTGVVVDSYSVATAYGYTEGAAYYLQSGDAAAWNSLAIHIPTANMSVGSEVQTGDEITVTGTVTETSTSSKWVGATRITNASYTEVSTDNVVTAYVMDAADLNADEEMYESQLIKIETPTFVQANSYDWTFEDADGDEFLVDNDLIAYTSDQAVKDWFSGLEDGTTDTEPDYLIGVWVYSYGTFKLEVRGAFDVAGLVPEDGLAEGALPLTYKLNPVYPNPFNPSTTISFQVPELVPVKAVVYNMLGQKVKTLIDRPMQAGNHHVVWNGVSEKGMTVASGVYFLNFEAGDFHKMQKMVLIK